MGFVGTQFSNKPFKKETVKAQGHSFIGQASKGKFWRTSLAMAGLRGFAADLRTSAANPPQTRRNGPRCLWLAVVHACHRKPKDWSNWSKAAAPKVRCGAQRQPSSRCRRYRGAGYKYAEYMPDTTSTC